MNLLIRKQNLRFFLLFRESNSYENNVVLPAKYAEVYIERKKKNLFTIIFS